MSNVEYNGVGSDMLKYYHQSLLSLCSETLQCSKQGLSCGFIILLCYISRFTTSHFTFHNLINCKFTKVRKQLQHVLHCYFVASGGKQLSIKYSFEAPELGYFHFMLLNTPTPLHFMSKLLHFLFHCSAMFT